MKYILLSRVCRIIAVAASAYTIPHRSKYSAHTDAGDLSQFRIIRKHIFRAG